MPSFSPRVCALDVTLNASKLQTGTKSGDIAVTGVEVYSIPVFHQGRVKVNVNMEQKSRKRVEGLTM